MGDVIIRTMQPGDASYVSYLHIGLYGRVYQFKGIFEYYVMKGLSDFLRDHDRGELWVAEADDGIAGSIAVVKSSHREAQLKWFIVDTRYQGMGIGRRLFQTAMDFCGKRKYKHAFLWTVSAFSAAHSLYQAYNFQLTEEKKNTEWADSLLIEERWDLEL